MTLRILTLIICGLLPFSSAAQSPQNIIGKWADETDPTKQIQMTKRMDGTIYGKAIRSAQSVNAERIVFTDLVWDDRKKVYTGLLIDPGNGNAFTISITLPHPNRFEFVVKRLFLSRTFRFVRIE